MDKETRQELRRRCPTPEETDALIDMAYERDRYRALLEECKPRLVILYEHDDVRRLCKRIDAALEGKNNG